MSAFRLLLLPFSLIYGLTVWLRNHFYDKGYLRSYEFDLPVISVGNLEVGGAGKTPMIEYLVRLLGNPKRTATLSRGYGRKTKGMIIADAQSTSEDIGDEPMQFKTKFPKLSVVVSESRVAAIEEIKDLHDLILLDDAFQHRRVKPGLSILLMDYNRIGERGYLLPAGNMRESKRGMQRADILVVTKSPKIFSPLDQRVVEAKIKSHFHKPIFYSYISYGELIMLHPGKGKHELCLNDINRKTTIILLTGIAKAQPLIDFLELRSKNIVHLRYGDHYKFEEKDIAKLADTYNAAEGTNKLIITTEKDAMRLLVPILQEAVSELPIHYLPIQAELCERFKEDFDQRLLNYVAKN